MNGAGRSNASASGQKRDANRTWRGVASHPPRVDPNPPLARRRLVGQDPVVTPDGVLYDKEHILHCLLHQKKEMARKLAVWEEQEARDADKRALEEHHAREEAVAKFHRENHGAGMFTEVDHAATGHLGHAFGEDDVGEGGEGHVASSAEVAATQFDKERMATMKAFWLPSKTPTAERRVEKPLAETTCPTTLKKLRMKDLLDVKWTPVPKSETSGRYMCPITFKTFTNATQVLVLKPGGQAVSEDGFKRVVEKEGKFEGKRVKGVIRLQKGGCGFAASGTQVESKKEFLVGAGSGLADSRGQHRGATSKFGLVFQ